MNDIKSSQLAFSKAVVVSFVAFVKAELPAVTPNKGF